MQERCGDHPPDLASHHQVAAHGPECRQVEDIDPPDIRMRAAAHLRRRRGSVQWLQSQAIGFVAGSHAREVGADLLHARLLPAFVADHPIPARGEDAIPLAVVSGIVRPVVELDECRRSSVVDDPVDTSVRDPREGLSKRPGSAGRSVSSRARIGICGNSSCPGSKARVRRWWNSVSLAVIRVRDRYSGRRRPRAIRARRPSRIAIPPAVIA